MTIQLHTIASPSHKGRPGPPVSLSGQRATHHTFDEMRRDILEQLAAARGLRIDHHEPRDGLAGGPTIVLDFDYWWTSPEERERGLRDLLAREVRPAVVIVYGWQLDDDDIARLNAAGMHAFNRLDETLVDTLVGVVARLPLTLGLGPNPHASVAGKQQRG
jgi:hypothetical protein